MADPTPQQNFIIDLLTSKKAIVMLIVVVAVTVLAALSKVQGQAALDFIKWVVMAWLGSQAVVDAAAKLPPKNGG